MTGGIKVQVCNQSLGDMLDVAVQGEQESKPGQQYQQAFRSLVYGNGAKRLNQSQRPCPTCRPIRSVSPTIDAVPDLPRRPRKATSAVASFDERRAPVTPPKPVDGPKHRRPRDNPSLEPTFARKIQQHDADENRENALARQHQHEYPIAT